MADTDGLRARRPQHANGGSAQEEVDRIVKHTDYKSKNELGFLNWLAIIVVVGILYGGVVWQDRRMPPVVPANQTEKFSEKRARVLLNALAGLGPRPSGSDALEVHAVGITTRKIDELKGVIERKATNRMEVDIQHPTGCFNLKFLSSFTLCYHKITNIAVRIGPKQPSAHSILLNCHFDTLPDTPGATDDAVSCAILMEVLEILSHSSEPLENDIIFLFNGAEENFLQASHGFITQHPWRHTLRAFINLEGTGSGGREILFQAGPGDSWLLKTYLENAPHPHCSVIAQEVFQSGIIPSDTDFRVFRDYGRVSGLDIAYHRNGWVYHTEFDRPESINVGSIQRAGENIIAVTRAIIKSPYIRQPAHFNEGNKWVFYDVMGLFTVFYEVSTGAILNCVVAFAVFAVVYYRIRCRVYSFGHLLAAFGHHLLSLFYMIVVGVVLAVFVKVFNLVMFWYSMPELVFPFYILPMIVAGSWAHSTMSKRNTLSGVTAEMFHYDSVLVYWSVILLAMTFMGLASSFFVLIHVLFPLLRDPLIYLLGKLGAVRTVTPRVVLYAQCVCMMPVMTFVSYADMLFFDFFVPVMGRLGNGVNPELIMMPLSLLTAWTFILFTNNLIYISRRMDYLLKCAVAACLFGILVVSTTSVGVPYKYSETAPRLRRIIALHARRNVYNFDGSLRFRDNGLFVQALDYRGIKDLPDHTFLQGTTKPDCSGTQDEYCQLPYYTAIHELFPPEESRWVPLPTEPPIPKPLSLELLERSRPAGNELNLTFVIRGGYDKMSLHVTPINGYSLKDWSFAPMDHETFGHRRTYFVFLTYGHEAPVDRTFSILLENQNPNPPDPETSPSIEIAVATHYAHGPHQNSETLNQLRSLISNRRKTPHHAVGYWRWAITMIGGCSELIAKIF